MSEEEAELKRRAERYRERFRKLAPKLAGIVGQGEVDEAQALLDKICGEGPPSARGLFAATGKVAKEPIARVPQDFYVTPSEATRVFLRAERDRLLGCGVIWECAAGDGTMVKDIRALDYDVFASDITDRGCKGVEVKSFFDYDEPPGDIIITNPPFSLVNWRDGKARWITHAMAPEHLNVEYMALLLPWTWLGAAGLAPTLKRYPIACIYLLTWKLDFTGQGAPPQLNAWFVWDRHHRGETLLRRLDRKGQGVLL